MQIAKLVAVLVAELVALLVAELVAVLVAELASVLAAEMVRARITGSAGGGIGGRGTPRDACDAIALA